MDESWLSRFETPKADVAVLARCRAPPSEESPSERFAIKHNNVDCLITDEPGDWRVETTTGRPFLTLRIQKSHVGLYLLPMYYHQHIRPKSMDAYLKGKSTFRFVRTKPLPKEGIQEIIDRARAMIGTY